MTVNISASIESALGRPSRIEDEDGPGARPHPCGGHPGPVQTSCRWGSLLRLRLRYSACSTNSSRDSPPRGGPSSASEVPAENGAKFNDADTPSRARHLGHDSIVVTRIGLKPLPHLSHLNISLLPSDPGVPTSALRSGIHKYSYPPNPGRANTYSHSRRVGTLVPPSSAPAPDALEEINRQQYQDDQNDDSHDCHVLSFRFEFPNCPIIASRKPRPIRVRASTACAPRSGGT